MTEVEIELEPKQMDAPNKNSNGYQNVYNPNSQQMIISSNSLDIGNQIQDKSKIDFNEAYKYDRKARQNLERKAQATYKAAAITLFKAYFGTGILALPYCFYQAGWLLSLIIFLSATFVLMLCVYALLEVSNDCKKQNAGLSELADQILGAKGVYFVRTLLIVYQCGKCTAGLMFFIRFFSHVMSNVHSEGDFIYVVFALCIVVPMGFIDNMAFFAKFSLLANILQHFTIWTIVFYSIYWMTIVSNLVDNFSDVADFQKFPMVIGVSYLGMGVVPVLLPIKNSMIKQEAFLRLFNVISYSTVAIYVIFLLLTVWAFGPSIQQIFLFTLGSGSYPSIAQVCYAVAVIMTYPVQLLPALQQIEKWGIIQQFVNPDLKYSKFRRVFIRLIINVLMALIAYGIPHFAYFINILGAIGGTLINFLLPIGFHYKIFNRGPQALSRYTYIAITAYSTIGGLCAFFYSIIKLSEDQA